MVEDDGEFVTIHQRRAHTTNVGIGSAIPRCALVLSVLTCLVSSQRSRFESFRVVPCAARCAIHPTSYPIRITAVPIALALLIGLDVS
jgi:hypothetical protein